MNNLHKFIMDYPENLIAKSNEFSESKTDEELINVKIHLKSKYSREEVNKKVFTEFLKSNNIFYRVFESVFNNVEKEIDKSEDHVEDYLIVVLFLILYLNF